MNRITFIIALALFTSCMHNNTKSDTNNSLSDKSTIKPKHEARITIPDFLVDVWGTPHCADVNISFNQNGEFVFNDYYKDGNYIAKEGTFDFKDNKVILHYKDGDSLILKLKLLEYEEFNDYYLYTDDKSHYLVKGLRVPSPEELDSLTSLIYCEDK